MTKLKWLGARLPKTVELPIPFMALSAKTGEVICNPVGEFDDQTATALLGMAPDFWERVDEQEPVQAVARNAGRVVLMNAPIIPKKKSGFAIWNERQRALKAAKQLEPSQPKTEGSQSPSPEREGQVEVV
jgi:virulence-associated protein VagC